MAEIQKIARAIVNQRWLRDFTSEKRTYLPETKAKPARMQEGFELKADGTYCDISSGANDAIVQSEGTWRLGDDKILTLFPHHASGVVRKIRIIDADKDKLVVEE